MDPNTRLLGLSTGVTAQHGGSSSAAPPPDRTAEDMQFLRQAISSVQGIQQHAASLESVLNNKNSTADDRISALDEVDADVEDIDNAGTFVAKGSHRLLIPIIKNEGGAYDAEEVRLALHIIANCAQNHPKNQMQLLQDEILDVVAAQPDSYEVLYAMACMCRGWPPAMIKLVMHLNGLSRLYGVAIGTIGVSEDATKSRRVRLCAARFLMNVLKEHKQSADEGAQVSATQWVEELLPALTFDKDTADGQEMTRCAMSGLLQQLTVGRKNGDGEWTAELRGKARSFVDAVTDDECKDVCAELRTALA